VRDFDNLDAEDAVALRLRALRVDPPEQPFAARLHERLSAAGPPPAPRWWFRAMIWLRMRPQITWPTAGILAGVSCFVLLMAFARPLVAPQIALAPPGAVAPSATLAQTAYRLPASKVALVRLNFAAEVEVEDVTFDVELPDGLVFWSRGRSLPERHFRWAGRLEAGQNWIPIAVKGERPGRFRVKARVQTGAQVLENEIVFEVEGGA
jgi:hypothetical protein